MNNISLVKVSVGIVIAAAATFFTNANEILPAIGEIKSEVEEVLPVDNVPAKTFIQLLSQYDADKDGSLSETELLSSDNEALKIAFKKLDTNQDSSISQYEFTAFTGNVIK